MRPFECDRPECRGPAPRYRAFLDTVNAIDVFLAGGLPVQLLLDAVCAFEQTRLLESARGLTELALGRLYRTARIAVEGI